MTLTGGAHCAPSGLSGGVASGGLSDATNCVNAMDLPSGDQAMAPGASTRLVSSAVCPLSIQRTYNCGLPSAADTYARRVPSGDQRGELKFFASERSGRLLVPSAFTIHRLRRAPSVLMSWLTRTQTLRVPPRDLCTSTA